MNFTEVIKAEILAKPIKDNHCKKAFIAGLVRGSGVLYEKDDELGLEFKAPDEQTAMMITKTFSDFYNYEIREVTISEDKQTNKEKYYLNISGKRAVEILTDLGILIEDEEGFAVDLQFFGELTKKECCLKAFLRGLFVASGRCYIPDKHDSSSSGYLLEIYFSSYAPALETSQVLAQNGISAKISKRRGGSQIYIKSAEEIKDFVAFLPAPVSVLKITEQMVERELSNAVNRRNNCDLANITKQVDAMIKQTNAIKKIEQTIGLESLKEDLLITAKARQDYPDDTLNELAVKLNVSKSCLNHRLRRIVEIANSL